MLSVAAERAGAAGSAWTACCRTVLQPQPDVSRLPPTHLPRAGAIVVDGVVASELTSIVPPALAGPTLQRGMAAGLRLAFKALPASAVEAAVRGVSSWVHGVADAAISAQALLP